MAIANREQFQDLVIGFASQTENDEGNNIPNTDWPSHGISFPVFWLNVLEYLADRERLSSGLAIHPGEPVEFSVPEGQAELVVIKPDGEKRTIHVGKHDLYQFIETDLLGIYRVESGGRPVKWFCINLFDEEESQIALTETPIEIGYSEIHGETDWTPARREFWPWLLGLALVILVAEWYIYNRRVVL